MYISSFEEDLLDLREFSERLQRFIETEHEFVEGSLVVGLNAQFGAGKSTFLRMWRTTIESSNGESDNPFIISLNAWQSDYNGDPLFAIISALVEALQENGQKADNLVQAAKDFGWFATAIGSQVINRITGIDPIAAGRLAEDKRGPSSELSSDCIDAFSAYEGRKNAMRNLKEAISNIVSSAQPRALFLVDELDRCRPDYAISYLETIKHLFDEKGAVFVLATDRDQLENSAKTAFGAGLNFDEYYRKFVHREVELPPIADSGYQKLAESYVQFYLERDKARYCFMKIDSGRTNEITKLIGALRLTPRQIQEMFRILGHVFDTRSEDKARLRWCLGIGTIAMAAFNIGAPKIYRALATQQLEADEANDFLKKNMTRMNPDWWLTLFVTGGGIKPRDGETTEEMMERCGLVYNSSEGHLQRQLFQWSEGWGRDRSNRFWDIYEKIQQASKWG